MNLSLKNLFNAPVVSDCVISIGIPVRDEAAHLAATLDAFAVQVDLQNRPLRTNIYEILILANNCRDASAHIARQWQKRYPHINLHVAEICLPLKFSNIGFVRRRLMNEAFRRLTADNIGGGIIAATDADTRVAPDWIAQTLEEIKRGADAVGGRILIEGAELSQMDERARYFHLLDEEYRLLAAEYEGYLDRLSHDVAPRHHQHFNGSFAVTAEAFKRAGGVPDVPFLEDVAFYHALLRVDAKVRHSPAVKVYTSSRHLGRSSVGLSYQLNEWRKLGEKGAPLMVEPLDAIRVRILARKALRECWNAAQSGNHPKVKAVAALARRHGVPRRFVFKQLAKPQTFGRLLETIGARRSASRKWHRRNRPVAAETAIADLKIVLKTLSSDNHLFKTKTQ